MNSEEKKIRKAFKEKSWNAIKTADSWQIFKIMSEFVDGFDSMSKIGPCVSVFGSARTKPENQYYQIAEEIGYLLTQKGYGVITGGGPGIMEAANKGAKSSEGLCGVTMADLNKDGKVSKEEFTKHHDAMFEHMDTNKDGFIERSEMGMGEMAKKKTNKSK